MRKFGRIMRENDSQTESTFNQDHFFSVKGQTFVSNETKMLKKHRFTN